MLGADAYEDLLFLELLCLSAFSLGKTTVASPKASMIRLSFSLTRAGTRFMGGEPMKVAAKAEVLGVSLII